MIKNLEKKFKVGVIILWSNDLIALSRNIKDPRSECVIIAGNG